MCWLGTGSLRLQLPLPLLETPKEVEPSCFLFSREKETEFSNIQKVVLVAPGIQKHLRENYLSIEKLQHAIKANNNVYLRPSDLKGILTGDTPRHYLKEGKLSRVLERMHLANTKLCPFLAT